MNRTQRARAIALLGLGGVGFLLHVGGGCSGADTLDEDADSTELGSAAPDAGADGDSGSKTDGSPDGGSCDDHVDCTTDSKDSNGVCVHTPDDSKCDDKKPCTTDQCGAAGCLHYPTCDVPSCEDMQAKLDAATTLITGTTAADGTFTGPVDSLAYISRHEMVAVKDITGVSHWQPSTVHVHPGGVIKTACIATALGVCEHVCPATAPYALVIDAIDIAHLIYESIEESPPSPTPTALSGTCQCKQYAEMWAFKKRICRHPPPPAPPSGDAGADAGDGGGPTPWNCVAQPSTGEYACNWFNDWDLRRSVNLVRIAPRYLTDPLLNGNGFPASMGYECNVGSIHGCRTTSTQAYPLMQVDCPASGSCDLGAKADQLCSNYCSTYVAPYLQQSPIYTANLKGAGEACTANNQCASDNCASGVCSGDLPNCVP